MDQLGQSLGGFQQPQVAYPGYWGPAPPQQHMGQDLFAGVLQGLTSMLTEQRTHSQQQEMWNATSPQLMQMGMSQQQVQSLANSGMDPQKMFTFGIEEQMKQKERMELQREKLNAHRQDLEAKKLRPEVISSVLKFHMSKNPADLIPMSKDEFSSGMKDIGADLQQSKFEELQSMNDIKSDLWESRTEGQKLKNKADTIKLRYLDESERTKIDGRLARMRKIEADIVNAKDRLTLSQARDTYKREQDSLKNDLTVIEARANARTRGIQKAKLDFPLPGKPGSKMSVDRQRIVNTMGQQVSSEAMHDVLKNNGVDFRPPTKLEMVNPAAYLKAATGRLKNDELDARKAEMDVATKSDTAETSRLNKLKKDLKPGGLTRIIRGKKMTFKDLQEMKDFLSLPVDSQENIIRGLP